MRDGKTHRLERSSVDDATAFLQHHLAKLVVVSGGAAGTEIDMLIGGLHARMEAMVDKEFMLFSRRLSLNEELEETTLPGFIAFKTLISTLRSQVEEGDFEAASKTLTTFQALFEQRPFPKFQ